jgi:hypothetical protein
MKNVSVDAIKKEGQLLDPSLDQNNVGFRVAVVVMSAALVTGPDTESLATSTSYAPNWVTEISQRMHRAGLSRDGKVNSDHWYRGKKLTEGVWTDSLVAVGLMRARRREDGKWEHQAVVESVSH